MASNYIKEKEYKKFIKRYEDAGILIIPIVFAPCDFNRWPDLAKLQFFKPDGSNYGKPEIENFTYSDLIEFKRTDGILIPNPNINRYHLDLAKKVEESFKEFLRRKEKVEISELQKSSSAGFNRL